MLKRLLAVFLSLTMLFIPLSISGEAKTEYSGLNEVQTYFNRVIGSLARADYYETDVLASITLSQAVYESGWARYALPIGGRNLFGIKAYNTWSGMVFDPNEATVYKTYDDFLVAKGQAYINTVSAWRAHENWRDSVKSHSELFLTNSRYAPVIGQKDYFQAAKDIVAAGYCSDNGYAEMVAKIIEQYGFAEYDDLTPDEDGVVALTTDKEIVRLNIGESYDLALTFYPAEATPTSVVWASTKPEIATVDENGRVTAVAHGTALVSATLANGREACSLVYVDSNATVMESDVWVRTSPDINAANNGKLPRGEAIKILDDKTYNDASGNTFYKVSGYNTAGKLVSGYAVTDCIYKTVRGVSAISFVKDEITLKVGDEYEVYASVAPADATDTNLSWTSSDSTVASVKDGKITAKKVGKATVTASAANGVKKQLAVTVAKESKEYIGIVSSYSTLSVRSAASAASSSVGSVPFLSEVKVIGEPVGVWVKLTGKTSSGKTITGYSHSAYVRLLGEGETYKKQKAAADMKVYISPDATSYSFGTLIENSDYVAIGDEKDGFTLVVGIKNPNNIKAIFGYAKPQAAPVDPPVVDPEDPTAWYGRTASQLRVRKGAGTEYDSVGIIEENTDVIITGDATNGWYKIKGVDGDGKELSGYSSADYVIPLYDASVNITSGSLNLRAEPSSNGEVKAKLAKDQKVVAVGDAVGGWYKIEIQKDGKTEKSGYASADYIKINGKLKAESDIPSGFGLADPSLTLEDGILLGVKPNTTVSSLKKSFTGNVAFLDKDGKTLSSAATVGTGCKVAVLVDGKITDKADVIIKGDVSGDGKIDPLDYMLVKRSFLKTYDLSGNYLKAALVSEREELSIADYTIIKRVVLGLYNF